MNYKNPHKKISPIKKKLALHLLKVVFSIYLAITILITVIQMTNEYRHEKNQIKTMLKTTQAIFEANLTMAAWTFDSSQIEASLEGIQKISTIVGIEIINMDKPPNWTKEFPIRRGMILNKSNLIVIIHKNQWIIQNIPYLHLIPHHFQLKKNDIFLGEVIIYSSNQIIFNKIKFIFIMIVIGAIIKTIILWLLFLWAFNKFLGQHLDDFCQAMEKVDIDNLETSYLILQHTNIAELYRIETAYNTMFQRVLEAKNKLNNLNQTLEQKVFLRTQEIFAKNMQLAQINYEKSEFLNIAAHDLKNPLFIIKGFTQLILLKKDNNSSDVLKYVNFIENSVSKMIELINILLDIDKIESGKFEINLIELDLINFMKDLINLYTQQAQTKKIEIHLQANDINYFTLTDYFLLSQILDNLISNAIKFSPNYKTVIIYLSKKIDCIRIEIQDQGQGLSDTDKEKLFIKFSRLSAKPTSHENSTGLGLYISQKMALLLNTKIECESKQGYGAIFSLEIPLIKND